MTNAMTGYLTQVHVSSDNGVNWTKVFEMRSVTPPNEQTDEAEATHLESEDGYKEFVQALTDPGDMSLTVNHIEGSPTDDYVANWRATRDTRLIRITFPNARWRKFRGFVKGYVPDEITAPEVITATVTFRVTGKITRG